MKKTDVPLVVYNYRKPVAIIMPVKKELIKEDINKYFGFMKGKENGEKFVNRLRHNENEKISKEFKKMPLLPLLAYNTIFF